MAWSFEQIKFILAFPALAKDAFFCITSPATPIYNCIAFAMGFNDRWVDNRTDIPGHWWPPECECDNSPNSLIAAFKYMRFIECDDESPEDGFDKVALYMLDEHIDPISGVLIPAQWTHAAKVLSNNEFHSKMGEENDIHHSAGAVFAGTCYGRIYQFMKRPIGDRSFSTSFSSGDDCAVDILW